MSLKKSSYDWLKRFVEGIYFRVFGEEMTAGMRGFVKNLGYTGSSTFFVLFLGGVMQIVSGRIIGPSEYGKYTLIESTGQLLYMVMVLGISNSVIYYLAGTNNLNNQRSIAKTGFVLLLASIVLWALILFPLSGAIGAFFGFDHLWGMYLIIYSILFTVQYFFRSVMRGYEKMKEYALSEIVFGLVSIVALLILIFYPGIKDFTSPVLARVIGYIVLIIIASFFVGIWKGSVVLADMKKIVRYSAITFFFGVLVTLVAVLDRFVIARQLADQELGIYSAYLMGSNAFISPAVMVFVINFFPAAVRAKDKMAIFTKLNKLFSRGWLIVLIFSLLSTTGMVFLFGRAYPFNIFYLLTVSASAVLFVFYQAYIWQINSIGKKGIIGVIKVLTVVLPVQLLLLWVGACYFSLSGVFISMFLVNAILLMLIYKLSQRINTVLYNNVNAEE